MTYLALFLILSACVIALHNWRWGFYAAIVVALLQDPLRKVMPGVPGWMAMASVPVWLTAMAGAWLSQSVRPGAFLAKFPRLGKSVWLFAGYLLVPAALAATYGRNSWQIALLGGLMYTAVFVALCCGWQFSTDTQSMTRLMAFYAILASVLLVGGPLENMGWNQRYDMIGSEAMGHIWFTHRAGGLYMLSGLFRSPDVMGWHASLVFMIAIILAIRSRGVLRVVWIGIAIWSGVSLWLCGRRKMVSMLPVFMGCYLLLIFKLRDIQRWVMSVGILLITLGVGWYFIDTYVHSESAEMYYLSTFTDVGESLRGHGFESVLVTIRQSGLFGHGLGMGQQGLHHIDAEMPRIWQESGPSKLVLEFGVPGAILLLLVMLRLAQTAYHVLRQTAQQDSLHVGAGIFAILVANFTSGLVSAQIYGDPFVVIMLALMLGLLFSAVNLGVNAETLKS